MATPTQNNFTGKPPTPEPRALKANSKEIVVLVKPKASEEHSRTFGTASTGAN